MFSKKQLFLFGLVLSILITAAVLIKRHSNARITQDISNWHSYADQHQCGPAPHKIFWI